MSGFTNPGIIGRYVFEEGKDKGVGEVGLSIYRETVVKGLDASEFEAKQVLGREIVKIKSLHLTFSMYRFGTRVRTGRRSPCSSFDTNQSNLTGQLLRSNTVGAFPAIKFTQLTQRMRLTPRLRRLRNLHPPRLLTFHPHIYQSLPRDLRSSQYSRRERVW